MESLRAIVLGIVQGLTEFLPVSSSGHLILVPWFFNWPDQGLAFDVGLHLGTLLALLIYFWRDWANMGLSALSDLRARTPLPDIAQPTRLLGLIVIGSVPAAVVGLLFNDWIEENVREPWVVAVTLILMGFGMLAAEAVSLRSRPMTQLGLVDAIVIGAAQALALIPGVSRSGATISMGLVRNLDRETAARFAFLLGTPAFLGAALLKSSDLLSESASEAGALAAGFVFSFVTGIAVIHWLLGYLRRRSLMLFVVYRWVLGVFTLLLVAFRA